MNKSWRFIFLSLLVMSLFNFVSAADTIQQTSQQIDSLGKQIDTSAQQIDNVINNPTKTKDQLRKEFLTSAWFGDEGLIAKNAYIGPIYFGYKQVSPYTDPIIKSLVGMTPALSWLFFLALFISITLIEYFYRFYEILRDFSTFSPSVSGIISLCFFAILVVLQFFAIISMFFADLIVKAVSLLTEWWMQSIALLFIFAGLFFAAKYSKQIEVFANKLRENKKKIEESKQRLKLELATKKVEAYSEELGKAFK